MEFLIGSIVTFIGLFFFTKNINKVVNKKPIKIHYSQSSVHEITKDLVDVSIPSFPKRKRTQSSEYEKKNSTRVVFMDSQAYWIESGRLTVAEITEEGQIDYDTKSGVDTYTMDKVQLDKTAFIVEKLTEGL